MTSGHQSGSGQGLTGPGLLPLLCRPLLPHEISPHLAGVARDRRDPRWLRLASVRDFAGGLGAIDPGAAAGTSARGSAAARNHDRERCAANPPTVGPPSGGTADDSHGVRLGALRHRGALRKHRRSFQRCRANEIGRPQAAGNVEDPARFQPAPSRYFNAAISAQSGWRSESVRADAFHSSLIRSARRRRRMAST